MSISALLTHAIERAGSETKLAKMVGCSQTMINKAKRSGTVSAEMAVKLEGATGLDRSEWRPDLWPPGWSGKTRAKRN